MGERIENTAGCLFALLFLSFGLVQLYAGYLGIEFHLGKGWAIGALFCLVAFRTLLPFTIGAFFGAMNVWHWPWYGALLFAAPGLVLAVPSMITQIIDNIRYR